MRRSRPAALTTNAAPAANETAYYELPRGRVHSRFSTTLGMWHGTRTHARGGPPHPCAQCARRKPEPWLISTECFRGCILRQGVPNLEAEGHAGLKPPFCITRSLLVEFKTQTRAQKMRALRQRLLGPRLHLKTHYRSRLTLNGPRMDLSVQDLKVERGTPSRSVKKHMRADACRRGR